MGFKRPLVRIQSLGPKILVFVMSTRIFCCFIRVLFMLCCKFYFRRKSMTLYGSETLLMKVSMCSAFAYFISSVTCPLVASSL